jgi:CBS domain-containing protein
MSDPRRHVIVTVSDHNCGDFLTDHWWPSLRDNVNLRNIDVVVLDYGLNDEQRRKVDAAGIIRRVCVKNGFVGNLFLRDMKSLLLDSDYDQAVVFDAGDIIFQVDFSHLFDEYKDRYRAVCEEVDSSIHDVFMSRGDFSVENWKKIDDVLHGKPVINGNSVFAPARNWIAISTAYEQLAESYDCYASNQVVTNYVLHSQGFEKLPTKYNFCLVTVKSKFRITNGRFYDEQGNLIPIVHNAGGKDRYRTIRNFGYGPQYNRPLFLHSLFYVLSTFKKVRGRSAAAAI